MTEVTAIATVPSPQQTKEAIDQFILPLLEERQTQAEAMHPTFQTLCQDIARLYSSGGKRFRPYMTLLTYSAYSNDDTNNVMAAAAAQELLHLAVLIHDDIIDRDDIRYGVQNISGRYKEHYRKPLPEDAENTHFAEGAAILAGDLLLSEAYHLLQQAAVAPDCIGEAMTILHRALFAVIGGELLDTEASFRGETAAHPLLIAEQKTASYSFVLPLQIGACLAGASAEQREVLDQLAQTLGIGFQIRDDIMGVFGDSAVTGKSTDGDLQEGKRTLLIEEFYRLATAEQADEFNAIFGQHTATAEQLVRARQLIEASGAKVSIESMITEYQEKATDIVAQLQIDDHHRAAFTQLVAICLQREK